MRTTVAIPGDIFTLMQSELMQRLRAEFDSEKEWINQNAVIEKAKELRLPVSFIQELRNDQI